MGDLFLFILIEVVVIIIPALFIFKSVKEYFNCLLSFLFGGYFAFWKKLWDIHFYRSLKFSGYFFIVLAFSYINLKFVL